MIERDEVLLDVEEQSVGDVALRHTEEDADDVGTDPIGGGEVEAVGVDGDVNAADVVAVVPGEPVRALSNRIVWR